MLHLLDEPEVVLNSVIQLAHALPISDTANQQPARHGQTNDKTTQTKEKKKIRDPVIKQYISPPLTHASHTHHPTRTPSPHDIKQKKIQKNQEIGAEREERAGRSNERNASRHPSPPAHSRERKQPNICVTIDRQPDRTNTNPKKLRSHFATLSFLPSRRSAPPIPADSSSSCRPLPANRE
jgi:hypothetical protein